MMMASLLIWAMAAVPVSASCVAAAGDQVTAGEMAKSYPEFGQLPADLPLLPAPRFGIRRYLGHAEAARVAREHHISLASEGGVCLERSSSRLTESLVREALSAALGEAGKLLELVDFFRGPVPAGQLEFRRDRLPQRVRSQVVVTWTGRVRVDDNHSVPIWARVRIETEPPGPRGTPAVLSSSLGAALLAKGAPVDVQTVCGTVMTTQSGTTLRDAREGDRVPVRLARLGKVVSAQATGKGLVRLEASCDEK